MNSFIGIILVAGLILTLSFLRTKLTYEFQALSLVILNSSKPGTILYTLVFLPGTIIHELSHWITAEILQVPTGAINIFPEDSFLTKSNGRLGSVETAKTDPFRGFLIGTAPLIVGITLLTILSTIFQDIWTTSPFSPLSILLIYAIVVIGNSMLTSRSDRRHLPFILIFSLLVYFAFTGINYSLNSTFLATFAQTLTTINYSLAFTVLVNISIISLAFIIRLFIQKLFRKRIVRA